MLSMRESQDLSHVDAWLLSTSWRSCFGSRAFNTILGQHLSFRICIGSSPARTSKKIADVNLMQPVMVFMARLMTTSSFPVTAPCSHRASILCSGQDEDSTAGFQSTGGVTPGCASELTEPRLS